MRKSGLHKRIAFIFDGVQVPEQNAKEPSAVKEEETADKPLSNSDPVTSKAAQIVARLKPVSKGKMTIKQNYLKFPGLLKQKKVSQSADAASAQRHQKNMTILAGVLSVVFIAVMALTFGGLGQTKTVSAATTASSAAPQTASQVDPESWELPKPLPEQMRDPLIPSREEMLEIGDDASDGQMQITGIVYSAKKPSVIIDGEVVLEGQVFKGATVLKVDRGTVELEKDGKRWTQHVVR